MAVLLYVACAAGGLDAAAEYAVRPLAERGWTVQPALTPHAEEWLRSSGGLEAFVTSAGRPADSASDYPPNRPNRSGPRPDAGVVAPATFNMVNKLAQGIADDRATTKLCELMGVRPIRPIVILPRVNAAHTRHPAWSPNLARLRATPGVTVLHDPDVTGLHEPGTPPPPLRWDLLLDAVGHPDSLSG